MPNNRHMAYEYESVQELLAAELRRRINKNPQYSLRSFARTLKLSPGALSEVLRGRRDLSLRAALSVAEAIGYSPDQTDHLLKLVQKAKAHRLGHAFANRAEPVSRRLLSEQIFTLVSEWYHFAILNLIDCDDFKWSAPWLSRRLGISKSQAGSAMDLLIRTGLVGIERGKAKCLNSQVLAESEIPSQAIRHYHRQILEKAIEALEDLPLTERDMSGIGFALDPRHLPALKKDIADFQDRVVAKFGGGTKTEVYFMEVALFKMTKGAGK